MKSPICVFPQQLHIVTDTDLYKHYIKHTCTKADDSTFKICIPLFKTGNSEWFLKFLLVFNAAMQYMGYDFEDDDDILDIC